MSFVTVKRDVVNVNQIVKEIKVELPADTAARALGEYHFQAPLGKVQRIAEIAVLDRPSQEFELSLHVNSVKRGAINALAAYVENNREPTLHAFDNDNCKIEFLDSAHFVATRHNPTLKSPISVRVRVKIVES